MQLTVLSSGPLSALALHGLLTPSGGIDTPLGNVICITNTATDISVAGLRFTPDTDAAIRAFRPNLPAASTATVASTLSTLGLAPTGDWPILDDESVAFAVARGYFAARGQSPAEAIGLLSPSATARIIPASDEPIELHVVEETPDGERQARHVMRWAADPHRRRPEGFAVVGLDRAAPSAGVLDALRGSDVVALLPMSPVLDAPGLLGVAGLRDALRGTSAHVVVMSPIGLRSTRDPDVDHSAWKQAGLDPSSANLAKLYADFTDTLLIDEAEAPANYPKKLQVVRAPLDKALSGDARAAGEVRALLSA